MQRIKKYFLKLFKKYFAGKIQFQKVFNFTKILSIEGLNFGSGGAIETGGEAHLMRHLTKKFADNRAYIVFDVGANEGGYCSALFENLQINERQIWCFEPSLNTFKTLKSIHGSKVNTFLINIGFSDQEGDIPLYHMGAKSDLASLFPLEIGFETREKLSDFELVSIKTIDNFMEENNIPYIDLLKLDIEGNELNALKGAEKALKSNKIKAIQFEFGTCNIDSRTFFRDFWNLLSPQYHIYRIVKNGLYPINMYLEHDEIFATINYFAELK